MSKLKINNYIFHKDLIVLLQVTVNYLTQSPIQMLNYLDSYKIRIR